MTVYLGEPGLPKPHAVPMPAAALMPDFLRSIGADCGTCEDDRQRELALAADWGRTVIVSGVDGDEVYTREIPEAA